MPRLVTTHNNWCVFQADELRLHQLSRAMQASAQLSLRIPDALLRAASARLAGPESIAPDLLANMFWACAKMKQPDILPQLTAAAVAALQAHPDCKLFVVASLLQGFSQLAPAYKPPEASCELLFALATAAAVRGLQAAAASRDNAAHVSACVSSILCSHQLQRWCAPLVTTTPLANLQCYNGAHSCGPQTFRIPRHVPVTCFRKQVVCTARRRNTYRVRLSQDAQLICSPFHKRVCSLALTALFARSPRRGGRPAGRCRMLLL